MPGDDLRRIRDENPSGRFRVGSIRLISGGSQNDYGYRIAVDQTGHAYVVGATQSTDMPHTNAFGMFFGNNGTNATNFDAFLTKFDINGIPVYTAQFGGTDNDSARGT